MVVKYIPFSQNSFLFTSLIRIFRSTQPGSDFKINDLSKDFSINVKRKYLKKTIGTNVKYAAWIEYGKPIGGKTTMKWKKGKGLVPRDTSPLGPRPYFRPAFQNNKDKVSNFFIRNLPQ
jgi:hypothetical protein